MTFWFRRSIFTRLWSVKLFPVVLKWLQPLDKNLTGYWHKIQSRISLIYMQLALWKADCSLSCGIKVIKIRGNFDVKLGRLMCILYADYSLRFVTVKTLDNLLQVDGRRWLKKTCFEIKYILASMV